MARRNGEDLGTARRIVGGAGLVGVLAALWPSLLGWLAERLDWPAPAAYASLMGGMLAIGFVGGYLLRSWRAVRIVPVAVVGVMVVALVYAESRSRGESSFIINALFVVAPYAIVATLGAALGVRVAGSADKN